MKQKHVGILYLLYFLLFLVDCYATRISLYSSIGEGYGLAASLSHVLGACLLYWSQRDARRRACPFCFRGFIWPLSCSASWGRGSYFPARI